MRLARIKTNGTGTKGKNGVAKVRLSRTFRVS
jgi:hypothetical protein